MTKAEQKKLATKARNDFIDAAAALVLESIGKHLTDRTEKCSIRVNLNGKNRYFNFGRYGENMRIAIYRSGDIDIRFNEAFHDNVDIRVVHYEDVPADPVAALTQLKEDLDLVIDSYLNYYWHAFMDYQWLSTPEDDWRQKARYFQEECKDL
jgi:hypothetical protein